MMIRADKLHCNDLPVVGQGPCHFPPPCFRANRGKALFLTCKASWGVQTLALLGFVVAAHLERCERGLDAGLPRLLLCRLRLHKLHLFPT